VHTFHGHVFHSYFGKIKTLLFKIIERRLAKRSNGIIAISEIQQKELSEIHKICPAEKIKVIPLGFDLKKFNAKSKTERQNVRLKYDIKDNEVAIAIIGRLTGIKNHDFFLQVIHNILEKNIKNIKVYIVGDGELKEEIEQKVSSLNAKYGKKLIMTSWILDIATFNAGMDIICLTSDNEGTPVSLIEAQASEVVVITTNVGGVKDIMLDQKSGFIVEKGDLKEYTEKLAFLIENDEIRKEMANVGWNFVCEKFHYERLAKDMELYYADLLSKVKK
jgi:glycosyltransferase involved in cell wall biosynthesis